MIATESCRLRCHVLQKGSRISSPLRLCPQLLKVKAIRPFSATSYQQSPTSRQIEHTSARYPLLQRDPKFEKISPQHISHFRKILDNDAGAVIDGSTSSEALDSIEGFNSDWLRKYRGHTKLVLRPKTTEEVANILKYCNDNMLAVVPQGGNTGLVGGSVPVFDEIIISMTRMNKIREFDDTSGVLVTDAGVVLEVADNFLAERHHLFPLDLGAKGSCQIGGNVATNAGGLRLLRYGSLKGNVLGLEVVLPDGTIVDDLSKLRKNNTGYDLKQLFIGSEGTLGIITGVSTICPARPKVTNVAYLGLPSFQHVLDLFKTAKARLGEILSAFEMMDSMTQDCVYDVTGKPRPLDNTYPFYCLIETSGSHPEHDSEKIQQFLEEVLANELVSDGVLAQDQTQQKSLWAWREGIPAALGASGPTFKYDISIPIDDIYKIVGDTSSHLESLGLLGIEETFPAVGVLGYGHMGDSNLHLNIVSRTESKVVEDALQPWVYEWVRDHNGSISAEHGLGLSKKNYIQYSRSDVMIRLMKQIKQLYDPKGIMNPYKYI